MSETWKATTGSVQRFRVAWRNADEDTRYKFFFYFAGLSMMAVAIVAQFGWFGALFCFGCVVKAAGES